MFYITIPMMRCRCFHTHKKARHSRKRKIVNIADSIGEPRVREYPLPPTKRGWCHKLMSVELRAYDESVKV